MSQESPKPPTSPISKKDKGGWVMNTLTRRRDKSKKEGNENMITYLIITSIISTEFT